MTSGALVLIVEDNEKNMKLARDLLQHHGFRTLEAPDAESGLQFASALHPDLVLMDIELPGMDGIEALRRLREDPATASIPVVAVTASVMPTDRERVTSAGFDGWIAKPIDIRAFPEQVREYTHSEHE